MDFGEVAQWILPREVDHADNEAKHLIHETDSNKVTLSHPNTHVHYMTKYAFVFLAT